MMRLPQQAGAIARGTNSTPFHGAVAASGCSVFKKISCAAALAACAAVCIGSAGAACASCLSAIGAGGCLDCV